MTKEIENIKKILKTIVKKKITPLHEPYFDAKEITFLTECIKSGYVSTVGKSVNLFEKKISELTKSKYCISVVNGTSAIHLGLLALGVKRDDEVLLPSLGFVAVPNAISYCGAVPNFVDSEKKTLGVCSSKLNDYLKNNTVKKKNKLINKKTGREIKGLISIHLFGYANDLTEINKVCKKFGIFHFEDASEAIGSYYKNKHLGTFSDIGCLSFNGNKTITTGGGGMILTNKKKLNDFIRHVSTTAKVKHPWVLSHDMVGYNYRMPNLNASLGLAQLEKLKKILRIKKNIHKIYQSKFNDNKFFELFSENKNSKSNHWLNTLLIKKSNIKIRDKIFSSLIKENINCRPTWKLLHKLPMYKNCPRDDLKVSKELEKRIITLPSSPNLTF